MMCKRAFTAAIILSAVAFSAAPVRADGDMFKASGHLRIRAEGDEKTDLSTAGGATIRRYTLARVRPDFVFTPVSDVSVFLQPQFAKTMGLAAGTSGATTDGTFDVHQAYADVQLMDGFKFLAGRQVLSYGDELVIGALDWNNVGRSFDAGRFRAKYGMGTTDLFHAKITETNAAAPTGTDRDFYGLYNSFDFGDFLKAADLYVLFLQETNVSNLWTTGVRLKSDISGLDYRVEAGKQFNAGIADGGMQVDGEFGYKLDMDAKPRFAVEGFYADKNYLQLFPTAHKWLGYADILGRRNVLGFAVHAGASLGDSLGLNLSYHNFMRADDATKLITAAGTGYGSAASTEKTIANEFDLTAKYQFNKAVAFSGGGAAVLSGKYLKDSGAADFLSFYFVDMTVKF